MRFNKIINKKKNLKRFKMVKISLILISEKNNKINVVENKIRWKIIGFVV